MNPKELALAGIINLINSFCGGDFQCKQLMSFCTFSQTYSNEVNLYTEFDTCKNFITKDFAIMKERRVK